MPLVVIHQITKIAMIYLKWSATQLVLVALGLLLGTLIKADGVILLCGSQNQLFLVKQYKL